MATALAEAGSNIVICSRKLENCAAAAQGIEKLGVQALGLAADVTKPDQVEAVKDATLKQFGRVDVLVNNAGRAWVAPPEEMPLERWQQTMDLNITAPFICSQAFGREMIKARRGKIINIASIAGLIGRNPRAVQLDRLQHEQGRARQLHTRSRGQVGAAQHQRELHLPGLLCHADQPEAVRAELGADPARDPAGTNRGRERPEGYRSVARIRRVGLHHRGGDSGGRWDCCLVERDEPRVTIAGLTILGRTYLQNVEGRRSRSKIDGINRMYRMV